MFFIYLMDISNNTSKLVCRKCGGAHITIKCGKDKPSVIESKIEQVKMEKPVFTNTENKKFDYKSERKPLYKVKMSNLPVDMTEEELLELLYDWGRVIRLRLLNYDDNSTAYIEFKDEEEAKYLVEALHKTPFEQYILDVIRLYD